MIHRTRYFDACNCQSCVMERRLRAGEKGTKESEIPAKDTKEKQTQ